MIAVVHISEKSDLELLTKMIGKFCSQNKDVRFGNYVFGPPVMRLLYHLGDPNTALKLFKDEAMEQNGFFDQIVTYQLILDLLFTKGRYQDVLDTFEIIKNRQVQGGRFPKNVVVLAFAACYKLNSKASLEYATNLYREAISRGNILMRRGVTFFASLAVQQSAPEVALEVLSTVKQQTYLTVRSIKALALADVKRFDDVVPILRSVLEIDNPMVNKQTFPKSAVEQLKIAFEGNTNKDLQADFVKVVSFLEKHGHITEDSLDDLLCADIQQVIQPPSFDRYQGNSRVDDRNYRNYNRDSSRDGYGQRDNQRRFQNRDQFDNSSGRTRRPGLHELN